MKNVLKSRKGEGYIDVAIGLLASMLVLAFALNVFRFLLLKTDMDYFSKQLLETACVSGGTGEAVEERYDELASETGLYPSVSWEGTEYFRSGHPAVQYGETIRLQLTLNENLRGFGLLSFPVQLTTSVGGLSRRYWK